MVGVEKTYGNFFERDQVISTPLSRTSIENALVN